ncbi:xanthine dehydrogenase family protein molybdopterin-binding subunit [Rhizobium mayense]|uniref:Xanthine dehydrogenase family protein molybdopterin-binding subunit n=1 Tax=Rhizobium mayense TaxID=1312184 RepID=A0ABT7JZ63_9HYPH|nr:xanthine dehydrogenase family protein molybdopterin-binding subunit [Rhizobium mayense]MDL2401641.1 xanthine dehydrogenase family protein molybdopterin-binding subunit [Rhizobium mayense]
MNISISTPSLSRRALLRGAAAGAGLFVIGTFLPFTKARAQEAGGPPQGIFDPNVFLEIAPDNSVTVLSKHFEMGQGITTGLATLVAEELDADWAQMRFAFAPANAALYNNLLFGPVQATGGTTSTIESWTQMRQVGAAARLMFLAAAASRWQVRPEDITIERGVLRSGDRSATFGELASVAMTIPVPKEVKLKEPKDWKLIGKRLPRLDSPEKTTGKAIFALDIRRPDTLTVAVRHTDQFGATVASFDATDALRVPGVVEVKQLPTGIAVYATNTWAAIVGRKALKVTWDTTKAEKRSTHEIYDEYRSQMAKPGLKAAERGDVAGALKRAARTIEAEFTFPYLAHAPMEPLNCTMELKSDGAEIWSGCQLQTIDQFVAARTLGLKPEQVKINTLLGGGSFGRRGNPVSDWTRELALAAKAIEGRSPVHLVWTREDDIKGGFYRPMAMHKVRVGLAPNGAIAGWEHRLASKPIFVGTPFEASSVNKDGLDATSVEGVVDTPYAIPDFYVVQHNIDSNVPVLWWRSIGNTHTAFAMETMIDELAAAAGVDPVAFRLNLLKDDARNVAVVRLAAAKANWGETLVKGKGRGIAFHKSFGTRVAMVADVAVDGEKVSVERIVSAIDVGIAINPDVLVAQVEGAIGFALSMVLRNRITLKDGLVEQGNFDDYEPTRMREMPRVEVHIVESTESPTGIGEPGLPPVAPAIGNAVAAAIGRHLHSLPLDLSGAT